MNEKTIAMNNLHAARKALLEWQPAAMYVRLAGKCPNCKRSSGYVSYQLADDLSSVDEEQCGYYCVKCEWSAAGARRVEE